MKQHANQTNLSPEFEELLVVVASFEHDDIVLEMLRHFLLMLPCMQTDIPQTIKSVCDRTYWESQEDWRQQQVGKLVSRLVDEKILPLQKDGKNSGNSRLYRRI